MKVFYSAEGDIIYEGRIFEIGGKNKDKSQIADVENSYLVKDDVLIGKKGEIPPYLFGFLS